MYKSRYQATCQYTLLYVKKYRSIKIFPREAAENTSRGKISYIARYKFIHPDVIFKVGYRGSKPII